jgi:hypothetical protein
VLLTQLVDVRADRLEDPQAEEAQQAHEREVEGNRRPPGGCEAFERRNPAG